MPNAAGPVELARVIRSGFHEGSHYGALVITNPDGSVAHAVGDIHAPIFPRSSNKPFQATAILGAGAPLQDADLALAAASHSGEPMHVDRALAMLARAGLTEDDLGCPPALPLDERAHDEVIRAGGLPRRIYMNCSGKHAGMLTACVAAGWDTASYLEPQHPLQRAVAAVITRLSGEHPSAVGVDGCGAPLFAISLAGLARAFGRANAAPEATLEQRVTTAMRAYPEMVGGTGRDDTLLMRAHPGLLAKGGAEGVHCAALADGRCVAIKISDGAARARMPLVVAALRWLGLDSPTLDQLADEPLLGGGRRVGAVEVAPGIL